MTETHTALAQRFPNYQRVECFQSGALSAYVLNHDHDVTRHPCYAYGEQIGVDVNHRFSTRLLIPPTPEAEDPNGWVLLLAWGYSSYSERWDQDSFQIDGELATGEKVPLGEEYCYEKYDHSRDRASAGEPERLLAYLNDALGHALTLAELGGFLRAVRGRFAY